MRYKITITNTSNSTEQFETGFAHVNHGVLEYFLPDSEVKCYMPICNLTYVRVEPLPEALPKPEPKP